MRLSDFDYPLPTELIAQVPLERRSDSRLLWLDGASGALADRRFSDLPGLLEPGDLLVFNDTRVMAARLFGRKSSGGRVEVLIERVLAPDLALAQVRASKSPKPGGRLLLDEGGELTVQARRDELFELRLAQGQGDFYTLMERVGHMPLPPYIQRSDGSAKGDWDVGITIDVMDAANGVDTVVLLSGDGDFDLLLDRIRRDRGVAAEVYGVPSLTADSLVHAASVFHPIEEDLLL